MLLGRVKLRRAESETMAISITRMAGSRRRWLLTLCATAVSTYALDLAATMAGLALAASSLLAGLDGLSLALMLVASYAFWAVGLRAALAANWSLLERTGTSINALSKAAHDIARSRSCSIESCRAAAAIGYVGVEVVKEVPYYAGAFGVALISETVTNTHAVIFLVGANLGAAAYEIALARLTRIVLRFLSKHRLSSDLGQPTLRMPPAAARSPSDRIHAPAPTAAPMIWPGSYHGGQWRDAATRVLLPRRLEFV